MAENLPEPPTFEALAPAVVEPVEAVADELEVPSMEAVAEEETTEVAGEAETEAVEGVAETADETETSSDDTGEVDGVADGEMVEGTAETETTDQPESFDGSADTGMTGFGELEGFVGMGEGVEGDGEMDREAAFAAIQAAAEAAASAEVAADAAARAEAVADVAIEIIGNQGEGEGEQDPRFAALGISPDYDAAEAEAFAATDGEEIPTIGDDALAARLNGLVPSKGKEASGETATTSVIVVGLVSVASIASFKRHLGRLAGVNSVGVSSGPDGEFVFAVTHAADANLRDSIPSLPSFQARVTSAADNAIHVTAHDPEADA